MNPIVRSGVELKTNKFFLAAGVDYLVEDKLGRSSNIGGGLDIPLQKRTLKIALSYSWDFFANELSKYYFLVSSPMKISLILTK